LLPLPRPPLSTLFPYTTLFRSMLLIDVRLTILSLAALPFLAFGLHSFNSRLTGATKRSEMLNSVAFTFIEETLKHLKVIQAFSQDRKSTRLNSSHVSISYAVFC